MTLLILTALKYFMEIKCEKLHSIFLVLFVKALVLFVFKIIYKLLSFPTDYADFRRWLRCSFLVFICERISVICV